jgi:hypothetical protein
MGPEFQFLDTNVSAWVPAAFTPAELTQGGRYLTVVARLKAGVAPERVAADLDAHTPRPPLPPRRLRHPRRAVPRHRRTLGRRREFAAL